MLIQCVSCAKKLNVPDNAAGKKARCPACKTVFDIVAAAAAVAAPAVAAPAVPAAPPPVHVDDNNEDVRPRRRFRDVDEEEEQEDRAEAPRMPRQTEEHEEDDAVAAGRNDVPAPGAMAGPGGAPNVAAQAGAIARWLRIAAFVLIAAFIVFHVCQYFVADTEAAIARRRARLTIPMNPVSVVLITAVPGLVVLGSCVALMLIGAGKARKLRGRGLVITGLIIAIVLGFLSIFGVVALALATMLNTHDFLRVVTLVGIQLVCMLGTAAILLIAGFRGLTLMGRPAMNEAFGVPAPSRPRGRPPRGRPRPDPDDDDDFDDKDYEPPRRRRLDDD
jgi:hypothetical protein